MPIIQQIGVYVMGTSGFYINCELSPLVPNIFDLVDQIVLDLYRPDGTAILDRALPLPESLVDINGKLRFKTQDGDLSIDGMFTVFFNVDYTDLKHLVFGGDFRVTDK
jgi:hypothetical protein